MKNGAKRFVKGAIKKMRIWDGYYYIGFALNGKHYSRRVSRLIAEAFLGKSNLVINHKNCDKLDNRVENLEWVTLSENTNHAYENKRIVHNQKRGWHPNTKIQENQFKEIFRLRTQGLQHQEIARLFGVSRSLVTIILNNKTKKRKTK